jgi:acetolactate synthase-1/2/3 large subunit
MTNTQSLAAGPGEEPYPDFVALARGFRCGTRRIAAKADVDEALEELIDAPGAYVLDVTVPYQEHVLPMIPSGMTVRDIIKT